MTTSKEAAAVALAEAVERLLPCMRPADEQLDTAISGCVDAYKQYRATPPPPDAVGELTAAERRVVDMAMARDDSRTGRVVDCEAADNLNAACAALRRARQPEPLEEARGILIRGRAAFTAQEMDRVRECIDAALAQKGGSRV